MHNFNFSSRAKQLLVVYHDTNLGPVHANPFSNENGAVLLRLQKDLRLHLSFSYHFHPSTLQRRSREKPHGSVCPPFWILSVEWSGARSRLFWWRHRFQIESFSPFTLENSVFKKHRFQIAPLWRAFSNGSVFGDRFPRCGVDDSRIRSKTAQFSFWKRGSVEGALDVRVTLTCTKNTRQLIKKNFFQFFTEIIRSSSVSVGAMRKRFWGLRLITLRPF